MAAGGQMNESNFIQRQNAEIETESVETPLCRCKTNKNRHFPTQQEDSLLLFNKFK